MSLKRPIFNPLSSLGVFRSGTVKLFPSHILRPARCTSSLPASAARLQQRRICAFPPVAAVTLRGSTPYTGLFRLRSSIRTSSTMVRSATFPLTGDCTNDGSASVPRAERREKVLEQFGESRTDPYYWLRSDSRDDPDVLAHLNAENAYTAAVLENPTKELREKLFAEMRARIKEDDTQPPYREDDWFYYTRMETGREYTIHCRRKVPNGAAAHSIHDDIDTSVPDEILLDENERAGSRQYYHVADVETSPDHTKLAWAEDIDGSEKYTMRFRDLTAAQDMDDVIENTSGDIAWADNEVVFFLTKDELDRPNQLWRYTIGSGKKPELVFTENDDSFYLSIHRSESQAYVYLHSGAAITSEAWYLPTTDPHGQFRCILPRERGVEYHVTDLGTRAFLVVTNKDALNSKLMAIVPSAELAPDEELIPHRADVKLESATTFEDYVVLSVRQNGLRQLVIYDVRKESRDSGISLANERSISFPDEAYALYGMGGEYRSSVLRFAYSSLITPRTIFDYDLGTGERAVKKVQPVLGGFTSDSYVTKRLWAAAEDGTEVPISIAYRPDCTAFPAPVHLEAYGSYETCNDPRFASTNLSLLDRGVVVAVAHVRGGGEMGRHWYEDGKFQKKHNTWRDFIACAHHLIEQGITEKGRMTIEGCSAGGLLVGATLNECTEGLFAGAVSLVGFSDVLTTMSDPSIPLTVTEWDEWGNPCDDEAVYQYMKGYSPYDNVPDGKRFPPILATAGLNDPRVGYWEPLKWVQRVRDCDPSGGVNVVYRCLMESGHFAKSGRFQQLEEQALVFAFVLKCLGKA